MTASQLKRAEPESPLLCGGCGHNLYGASGRCPECGRAFDPDRLIGDLIPWEQRKYRGYVRSYLRTAFWGIFRPREIARRVESPVSYRSAQAFRRITALLAFVPILLTAWVARGVAVKWYSNEEWAQLFLFPWSFYAGLLGLFLGLTAANHVAGWLFHRAALPRERRGRAYAVGCYAAAPMALFAIPVAIWGIALVELMPAASRTDTTAFVYWRMVIAPFIVTPLTALVVGAAMLSLIRLLRVATGCGIGRITIAAILLPFGWPVALAAGAILAEFLLASGVVLARSFF